MQYILLIFLFLSCAHNNPTKFQAMKKGEGYSSEIQVDEYYSLSFKANAHTKKQDADLFAKFRAIELCLERQTKYAYILGVEDKSKKKEVIRSSSSGFPSYSYGMSPFYNRYSSFGFGFSTFNTSTWNETYHYPEILIYYKCADVVRGPEILFREVSPEEMKLLVKDLKGGLQADKIPPGSPNEKIVETGDVLLKANGRKRIEKNHQLLSLFSDKNKEIQVEILREGVKMNKRLKSVDISSSVDASQKEIIKDGCGKKEIKERPVCKGL